MLPGENDMLDIGPNNDNLIDALNNIAHTNSLWLTFPKTLNKGGWEILSNTTHIDNVHIDFEKVDELNEVILMEMANNIKETAETLKQRSIYFKVHVQRAGNTPYALLNQFTDIVGNRIGTLDLTGSQINGAQLEKLLGKCNQLAMLTLKDCVHVDKDTLGIITEKCPLITSLSLDQADSMTNKELHKIVEQGQFILQLNLAWQHHLNNVSLESISNHLQNLRVLDLTNLNTITDKGLANLVNKCKYISTLNLNYCNNLSIETIKTISETSPYLEKLSIVHMLPSVSEEAFDVFRKLFTSRKKPLELIVNEQLFSWEFFADIQTNYQNISIKFHSAL